MITEDKERLYSLKTELRSESKKYRDSVKPLKDEIQLLEADIVKQVLEAGKTISVGGIKAEYKPTVIIRMKKEKENE